jgi:hypothetical protein
MATASTTNVKRTVTEKGIALILTDAEAETLLAIVTKVSGDLNDSPRKHTEAVYRALREAGVRDFVQPLLGIVRWDEHPANYITGSLRFDKYEKGTV